LISLSIEKNVPSIKRKSIEEDSIKRGYQYFK